MNRLLGQVVLTCSTLQLMVSETAGLAELTELFGVLRRPAGFSGIAVKHDPMAQSLAWVLVELLDTLFHLCQATTVSGSQTAFREGIP